MSKEISHYCKIYNECVARKSGQKHTKQHWVSIWLEPIERVALDILGPLPVSTKRNNYTLVMTDCFTKWTEAKAIPDQEAYTFITAVVNEIVCRSILSQSGKISRTQHFVLLMQVTPLNFAEQSLRQKQLGSLCISLINDAMKSTFI